MGPKPARKAATPPSRPFHKTKGRSGAPLHIQPTVGPSEHHANAFARATTGRTPQLRPDARTEQLSQAPAYVEQLIAAERNNSSDVRPIPEPLQAQIGPTPSGIRLHTGEAAGIASLAIGARAFCVGEDVFFAPRSFEPDQVSGRALIAHELAHALERGAPNRIARTPGVAYPDEQTAAREAFEYLLGTHSEQLGQEWGGYIYKQRNDDGAESLFHSEPRTDGVSGSVDAQTEEYARAELEDAQAQWDRENAAGRTPMDPRPRPGDFSPTPGWVEPSDIQARGGVLTATYHNHPKLGNTGNKAAGQSNEEGGPNAGNPFQYKWTGDIPSAHRLGLNSYMIDLDRPTGGEGLGYDIDRYSPTKTFENLDDIVGILDTVSNSYKCQWGFGPDGTLDVDGTKCAGQPPHPDVIRLATRRVESPQFEVAVRLSDISEQTCLRMLAAADMADETMRCGIDPRSDEQRKLDERRYLERIVDSLGQAGFDAHTLLGPDEDPMRPPR